MLFAFPYLSTCRQQNRRNKIKTKKKQRAHTNTKRKQYNDGLKQPAESQMNVDTWHINLSTERLNAATVYVFIAI